MWSLFYLNYEQNPTRNEFHSRALTFQITLQIFYIVNFVIVSFIKSNNDKKKGRRNSALR